MARAKRPLNPTAVQAANRAIAPQTGGRQLTMDASDYLLRKQWMKAYLANGGEVEVEKPAKALLGDPVIRCPAEEPSPYDCTEDPPQPIDTPDDDYYKKRHADFLRRHPVPPPSPPNYYIAYGDKYLQRFKALDSDDLSPAGLAWLGLA